MGDGTPSTHLLQQHLPILVEEENTEGSMENAPGCPRHKPMREVLVHVAHDLVVLVHRDHLDRGVLVHAANKETKLGIYIFLTVKCEVKH